MSITASIPKNDMGTLVAATFLVVAAVKTVEKLQKLLKRKKRPDVREVSAQDSIALSLPSLTHDDPHLS